MSAITNRKRKSSLPPCELCTSPAHTPGISYCYDCGKFLCSFCEEAHIRLKSFAAHTVIPASKMTTLAPPTKPRPAKTKKACSLHNKDAGLYCHDCDQLICSECKLVLHKSHQSAAIQEVSISARKKLSETKEELTQLDLALRSTKQKIDQSIESLTKEGKETEEFINQSFDLVLCPFEKYRRNLLKSLENRLGAEIGELRSRAASVHSAQKQLEGAEERVNCKLTSSSIEDVVRSHKDVLRVAKEKQASCRGEMESAVTPGHTFDSFLIYKTSSARIIGAIGDSLKSADPVMCMISGEGSKYAEVGKAAQFVLEAKQSNDAPCQALQNVQVELCSMADGTKCEISTRLVKGSLYEISYTPKTQGQHLLKVKVNDKPVLGNPFQIIVKRPILKRTRPILVIEGMRKIGDISVHRDGSLIATQPDEGTVIKVNRRGEHVQTLLSGLEKPYGIATSPSGAVFVSLNKKCCIQKYNKHRKLVEVTGCKDTTLGHFNQPGRMALCQRGNLMVCDVKNSRIQVFDDDLDYLRWYSISRPVGVSTSSDGNVYVSENGRNSLSKICDTSKMGIVRLNCNLADPQGIHVDDNYVYVAERGRSQLSVFTHEGELVTVLGKGVLQEPGGVAGDKDGYLYVCDEKLEAICVF